MKGIKSIFFSLALCSSLSFINTSVLYATEDFSLRYPVIIQQIEVKNMHEWLHVYGRVSFDDAAVQNINLPYSGQVIRLPLLAGEPVNKGQVLAEIVVDPAVAAAYQKALAGVTFAQSEVDRIKKMLKNHLATQSQWASAKKILGDNQSQLKQLQEKGFGKSIHLVRAEFDAVVASVTVQSGQRIVAGTTLMQLGHPNQLKIILGVEPEDMRHIQSGNIVLINVDSKTTIKATVERVLHTVDPQTRLVDVLVRLHDQQTALLLPGMTISAELEGRNFLQAFLVPRSALVQQEGKPIVMEANKGVAHRLSVRVLLEQGSYAVVTSSNLTQDTMIIIGGAAELHDGDMINVVNQL